MGRRGEGAVQVALNPVFRRRPAGAGELRGREGSRAPMGRGPPRSILVSVIADDAVRRIQYPLPDGFCGAGTFVPDFFARSFSALRRFGCRVRK